MVVTHHRTERNTQQPTCVYRLLLSHTISLLFENFSLLLILCSVSTSFVHFFVVPYVSNLFIAFSLSTSIVFFFFVSTHRLFNLHICSALFVHHMLFLYIIHFRGEIRNIKIKKIGLFFSLFLALFGRGM